MRSAKTMLIMNKLRASFRSKITKHSPDARSQASLQNDPTADVGKPNNDSMAHDSTETVAVADKITKPDRWMEDPDRSCSLDWLGLLSSGDSEDSDDDTSVPSVSSSADTEATLTTEFSVDPEDAAEFRLRMERHMVERQETDPVRVLADLDHEIRMADRIVDIELRQQQMEHEMFVSQLAAVTELHRARNKRFASRPHFGQHFACDTGYFTNFDVRQIHVEEGWEGLVVWPQSVPRAQHFYDSSDDELEELCDPQARCPNTTSSTKLSL